MVEHTAKMGNATMKYAVIIEKGPTSYGAQVLDLPGCVAVAETRDEVCKLIQEAIELSLRRWRKRACQSRNPSPMSWWSCLRSHKRRSCAEDTSLGNNTRPKACGDDN